VEVVLGKGSGTDSVAYWLERVQLPVPEPDRLLELTMLVKERAMEKHALVSEEEFREMAGQFLGK
jgi:hypothetical protein